jgi:hypothetical protein
VVANARLRQSRRRERPRPVRVDVLEQFRQERVDGLWLVAPARADRRARSVRAGEHLLEVAQHLLDALAEPLAAPLEVLARLADALLDRPAGVLDPLPRAVELPAAAG